VSATSEERPWGSWHVLDDQEGFKVKRIVVNPHSRLSYQIHHQRAEHWVVVAGKATCTVDGDILVAGPGDCVDVALRQPHRIANEEDDVLVIIEVGWGSYTGEDDIVRLEDDYGRVGE
jgi:mannose-6-phosphate isomerase